MVHGDLGKFCSERESIESYLGRFEFYCLANAVTEDQRKKAVFLSIVGQVTYDKLRDLLHPESIQAATFDSIVTQLSEHFKPQHVEIAERYKFFKCLQQPGQTVHDYVALLRSKAKDCNFGAYLETALRDQLVCGLNNERCKQELLCKTDLTLKSAVQHARSTETVLREVSCFGDGSLPTTDSAVHRTAEGRAGRSGRTGGPALGRRDGPGPQTGSVSATRSGKSSEQCWRCGNAHSDECRFKTYRCRSCHKVGHLARQCRVPSSSSQVHLQDLDSSGPSDGAEEVVQIGNLSDRDQPVYIVNRGQVSPPPIWCPITICGRSIDMELDTGAGVTLIDEHTYKQMRDRPKLTACPVRLRSYTGELIPVLGEFVTDVQYNGASHRELPVVVVKGSAPCLLGRNWLERMKICWSEVHALRAPPMERLKRKYPTVFSSQLGRLKNVKVKLDIDSSVAPKFCKARSLPFAYKSRVEAQLDADIKSGVLVPIRDSRWAAPIVPVVRADGKIRVCANFKLTANRAVRLDRYPLPRVEEMLAKVGAKRVWSKIDLASAYQQIEIHEDSREVLTINTSRGLLQYSRLPYGISCAVGVFQREIERILSGIPDLVVYLDDVLIGSCTEEEHWRTLDDVFNRLNHAGLRVRESKCELFTSSVQYLGHRISSQGVQPLPDKVKAIVRAPAPANQAELKAFVGLVTYYSRFISHRAEVMSPLYDLLRRDAKWEWGPELDSCFKAIKRRLADSVLLEHYDPSKQLVLCCDASSKGISAVLAHIDESGVERPISFASRRLSPSETKYSQIEREALAIILGVTRHHQYLCGLTRPFWLVTDHKPLIKLFGEHESLPEMASARIRRWALKLSNYNYRIRFKSTHEIANADCLSRLPCPDESVPRQEELVLLSEQCLLNADAIAARTCRDPVLSQALRLVQHGGWPDITPEWMKPYAARKHELSQTQGVLLWGHRVIVPTVAQNQVLQELHMGHPGIVKTKSLARSIVWWPSIDADITSTVQSCTPCQESRGAPPHSELHPWPWTSKPWSRIHMDFAEPVKGKYVLVVVDSMSKWIEAEVMYSTAALPTIAKLRAMFAKHGLPDICCSDNQSTFTCAEFQSFLKENGIAHRTIEPRHSRGNGLAERAVKEVKLALQREENDGKPWEYRLCQWLFRYRTTPHAVTSVTPAELLSGRKLKTRLDLLYPDMNATVWSKQNRQRQDFDRSATVRTFSIGDLVFAQNYAVGPLWLMGSVVAVDGPVSYVILLSDGRIWRRHADQLRARTEAQRLPSEARAPQLYELQPPSPPPLLPSSQPADPPLPSLASGSSDLGPAEPDSAGNCPPSGPVRPPSPTSPAREQAADVPSGVDSAVGIEAPPVAGRQAVEPLRRSTRVRKQTEFLQVGL